MSKIKITIFFYFLISLFSLSIIQNAKATTLETPCKKVETLFARGSGQAIADKDREATKYFNEILDRLKNSSAISTSQYELGTESYNGNKYPAVAVSNQSFANAIGASLGAGQYFAYGDSVKQGVGELKSYLSQRHDKCKSTGTLYILGGYSQGAQVVGQALPGLSKEIRDDIVFAGLFGDPKLHLPEGEGWNPPACRGKDFSPWRRAASNCNLDNGSLTARTPYLPEDMKTKTGLWCYAKDSICDVGALGVMSGHETYKSPGMAIDLAAKEAVSKLKQRLERDAKDTPTTTPKPDYTTINISRPANAGVSGNNVLFIVDVSDSMRPYYANVKSTITKLAQQIVNKGGGYHVLLYSREGPPQPTGILWTDTRFFTDMNEPIVIEPYSGQGSTLSNPATRSKPAFLTTGSPLYVFEGLARGLRWQHGATKSAMIFTNNPMSNDGSLAKTREISLQIDPVNFYPVVPDHLKAEYEPVAEATSGQVSTYDTYDKMEQAADVAYVKTVERPVPFLANANYLAAPGQEITFDASESYSPNANITKYEWDFDGNGTFEATTTTPVINHTYTSAFDGYMQVRVTADNDTVANMSAQVTIKPLAPPAPIQQPKQFAATVVSTNGDKSTVRLSWQANPSISHWQLTINDVPAGYIEKNQTSVEITDVDRTSDTTFGLAAVVGSATSSYSTVTVSALTTPTQPPTPNPTPNPNPTPPTPPVISTCTQGNFFLQILCQAIAMFKTYLNGILLYVLPYKI